MFRPTARRFAAEISAAFGSSCASSAPAAELLPPLQLYRRLLRVHRRALPRELRVMGDDYVKAEFRRTRSSDNPLHIVGFLSEWKKYLDFHESQLPTSTDTGKGKGKESAEELARREQAQWERVQLGEKLDQGLLEALSADQVGQLYELLQASKEVWTPPSEPEASEVSDAPPRFIDEHGKPLESLEEVAEGMRKANEGGR